MSLALLALLQHLLLDGSEKVFHRSGSSRLNWTQMVLFWPNASGKIQQVLHDSLFAYGELSPADWLGFLFGC